MIVKSDDVLGGKARIEGSRVSVEQVYEMYSQRDMSASEISDVLTTVDENEVVAAIEFMLDENDEGENILA